MNKRAKPIIGMTILLLVVGLSGCTSQQPEYKMEINIENQFSQDIEGFIEIAAHGKIGGDEDLAFWMSKEISMNSGTTESFWFDIPKSVSDQRFRVNFSAESGGYMSDNVSKAYYFFEPTGSQWLFKFKVYGTPPSMTVEFIEAITSD